MAKYTVSMAVDGRIDVEVEAENPDEAREKAIEEFQTSDIDFNKDMEIVDTNPVNCSDDKGDIVKDY